MREVAVLCKRVEERSEVEVCAEGGCEHGRGGYGCVVATAVAMGGMDEGEARVACL